MVILSGESGIGKTHSAKNFVQACRSRGDFVLSAKGRPNSQNPLYLVYEAIADILRTGHLSSSELREIFLDFSMMLPRISVLAKSLFADDPFLRGVEATITPARVTISPYLHCLDFIFRIAKGKPVLFWIDDLQWADRETLLFLTYLRDQLSQYSSLWLLCVNQRREAIPERDLLDSSLDYLRSACHDGCVHWIDFQRYSLDSFPSLIASILNGPANFSPATIEELYVKTRGVPFVLKVFLDVLRDRQRLTQVNGVYHLSDIFDIPSLPDSLRTAIESRLKRVYRLIPESVPVLETASVLGDRFEDTTIDAVLDLCNTYRLLGLVEENYFLIRNLLSQHFWEFEHSIVRDFIYDMLGVKAERIHRKIAQYLIAVDSEDYNQIAYHLQQGGDAESAIGYRLKQVEVWIHQGFFGEARRLLDELWRIPQLAEHPTYRERIFEFEYSRALVYFYIGEYESCLQMIHEIDVKCPDRRSDPALILLRAKCLNKGCSNQSFIQARSSLEGLLARPEVYGDSLLSGRIAAELVISCAHLNDFSSAEQAFVRAERMLNRYEAPIEAAQLMRRACMFYQFELTEKLFLRALEIFRWHRAEHEMVRTLNNLATLYFGRGDMEAAMTTLREAIKINTRLGPFVEDYLLNNMALIQLRNGEPGVALEGFKAAAQCAKRTVCEIIILNNQSAALLDLGCPAAALDLLQRLVPEALLVGEDLYIIHIDLNIALAFSRTAHPLNALLQLAGCCIARVGKFGAHLDRSRRAMTGYILEQLGAIVGTAPPLPIPKSEVIDMQFWGD
jgi:tetratricopeptide (TPR) repeat protein